VFNFTALSPIEDKRNSYSFIQSFIYNLQQFQNFLCLENIIKSYLMFLLYTMFEERPTVFWLDTPSSSASSKESVVLIQCKYIGSFDVAESDG